MSILGCKWNWSAWTLLGTCIGDGEEVGFFTSNERNFHRLLSQLTSLLQLIPLPQDHPLVQLFQIKTLNELHNPSEHELQLCDRLLSPEFFPNNLWLMGMKAHVLYHLHGK